jgi:hypothetical protein
MQTIHNLVNILRTTGFLIAGIWPTCSADLKHCDFFLGFLRDRVNNISPKWRNYKKIYFL